MQSSSVVIVSPALADANNGNWQTARRWQRLLARGHRVRLTATWPDAQAARDTVMLALHARRSAAAIAAWSGAHPGRGLGVVLTGTDLYHDIHVDPVAQRSLALAQRLVVLQPLGLATLPLQVRAKARVILQSTGARVPLVKSRRQLRALMVGHLRPVKSPETLFQAARLLADRHDIRIDHVGAALDPDLAAQALATARQCPNYRWLGGLPHGQVRQLIQRAHLLVHTSEMEGGAHVIMEAVRSGTPVLASRVEGNLGMLGADYDGYFPLRDARALAALLLQCRNDQVEAQAAGLLERLHEQAGARADLFTPAAEQARLLELVAQLANRPGLQTAGTCERDARS